MADTSSTTTFKADISSLRAEMQAAARVVKVANSEFKAATAGMDDWSSSADGLEAKIKQLDTVLKAQNRQVELAAEELEKTAKEYGENSAAADRARIKYNNFKAAAAATEKELNDYQDQLDHVEDATEDVEEATKSAGEGFTVMKGVLADLAASAIKAGIKGLKDLATETFKAGANFQAAMSQVEAVSGATAEEMDLLAAKAKEMGAKTKFSATESAEAFNYMAMAGWKTEDMIDGIEGIMALAAASGSDLATTSDIVTDALTAMGYSAKDAGRLADVMAAASSNANTNVELMGATFQYVAPVVGALGYNMEDTAVAIGMMANAGIKGEKAGTALRSILTRLSAPPKEAAEAMEELGLSLTTVNADGTEVMKDMDQVMLDLRDAFSGLSEVQQAQMAKAIAGQEAMSGLLAIVNGADEDFNNLTAAVQGSDGAAQTMADTMNDNVQGALTLLQSNIESKMIQVFEAAAPAIQGAIEQISEALDNVDWDSVAETVGDLAEKFGEFVTWVVENGETVEGLLKGIGTALGTIFVVDKAGTFITNIGRIGGAFKGLKTKIVGKEGATGAIGLFKTALENLPVLGITGALFGLGAAALWSAEQYEKQIEQEYGLSEAQQETINKVNALAEEYNGLKSERESAYYGIDAEYGYLDDLIDEYNSLIDENGKVKEGYEDRVEFIKTTLSEALGIERADLDKNIGKNGELGDSIRDLIKLKRAEALVSATQDSYTAAIQERGTALDNYTEALDLLEEKEEAYAKTQADLAEARAKLLEIADQDPRSAQHQAEIVSDLEAKNNKAKESYEAAAEAAAAAEETYVGFNTTIQNYEGLSAAIISGDMEKIATAVLKLENNFQTAETGTRESLEQQLETYRTTYKNMKKAVKEGTANISQEQLDEMKNLVKMAKAELKKLPEETEDVYDDVIVGIANSEKPVEKSAEQVGEAAADGVSKGASKKKKAMMETLDDVLVGIANKTDDAEDAGESVADSIEDGVTGQSSDLIGVGMDAADDVIIGIGNATDDAEEAGEDLAAAVSNGLENASDALEDSGSDAIDDVIVGIKNSESTAQDAGQDTAEAVDEGIKLFDFKPAGEGVGDEINAGLEAKGPEAEKAGEIFVFNAQKGVDSIDVTPSGQNFGQGYINGIGKMVEAAKQKARELAQQALAALKKAQAEGSPSKITYQSGVYFTQGYINGIASQQRNLVKTIQGLVGVAVNELSKLSDYNFATVGENASKAFSDAIDKQTNYMIAKIQYQNQDKLDALDAEIAKLQKQKQTAADRLEKASNKKINALEKKKDKAKSKTDKKKYEKEIAAQKKLSKKQIAASDKQYDKLIAAQEKYQDAYAKASAEMIAELQDALGNYQIQAQDLIDNTINGITSRYEQDYDNLIQKQDTLISKLKDAADLFEVSNAGVLLIGDIEDQTRQIREYTDKLRQIKEKVSSELFDQIAQYDMKEGNAFMNYLLGLSESELEAYNRSYTEKIKAATEAGNIIYGEDISNVAKAYQSEIEKAFKDLPGQLEELGQQAMQGFIEGLGFNTDYMHKEIRTFISAMIDQFKSQLQIHSPSAVTFDIGEYTGEGFVDGLMSLIKKAKAAAAELASVVSSPLDNITGDLSVLRGYVPASSLGPAAGIVNNYNLVQNNTSPKSLSALETYQARRRQIALVKAFA